jgi:SAM-dependent methyltransferase
VGEVYQHPKYYEIAFSFRDVGAEVAVFEDVIRQYSRIPVTRMLEVGCGPAPHLPELTRRGHAYVGLDLSQAMLAYAYDRAQALQVSATFIEADMRHFHLPEPVDFAFMLLGSLFVQSTADLTAHFDAMGQALKPGSLYLLDWCITFAPMRAVMQHGLAHKTALPSRPSMGRPWSMRSLRRSKKASR